jgi:hypothetical protein
MIWDTKNQIFLLLFFLLLTGQAQSQAIIKKKMDSLLQSGRNFSALKELNTVDTLQLKKYELATFHFYKAKFLGAESKYAKAFLNYLQAKRIYLEIDSLDDAMSLNLDIAFLLSNDKSNRKKAENYLKEYLNYALKKNENVLIAKAYSNWGNMKMEEQPLESLKLFQKSEGFSKKAQDFNQLENLYSNIGVLYNEMLQKPDSAIYYIDKSTFYAKKTNNKNAICINLINKASCYYYKEDYKKAILLLEEANEIKLSKNSKNIKSYILEFLAINYNELEQFQKAYDNLRTSIEIKTQLNFEDQRNKISEFNIQYETKEKEIENLNLKTKIERNQIITYSTLGLLLIGLVLTVLIYKNLSKKKKIAEQAQLIQIQILEKTLKNQELRDIDLMMESQEHERQQIANELHDNLGSLLATLKLNFQNLSRRPQEEDKILFDKTDALLEETYQKVRNIAHLKNLGVIGSEGLVVAVKKMAEQMSIINRLTIHVIPFGLTQRLSNSVEIMLFRMIQELATNIIKHSQADEVNIYLTQHNSDSINVIIEDNGKGFDYKKVTKTDGIGLKNIEKKVEQMEGTFTVDSIVLKGTTIIIDLPL